MRRCARVVLPAVAAIALARYAAAQNAFPSHDVRIRVTVAANGVATIREYFSLTAALDRPTFELLEDPCSSLESLSMQVDGRPVIHQIDRDSRAPWTLVHVDLRTTAARSSVLEASYNLDTTGVETSVPILVPDAVLEHAAGSRGADVDVSVTFEAASPGSRVLMPRLEEIDADTWHGRFLALPSFVHLRLDQDGASRCDRHVPGTAGGLEWRFGVLVATMTIWVAAYLWWFGGRRARP